MRYEYIARGEKMRKMPHSNINSGKIMKELETEFEGRGEIRNFHFKQLMKSGREYNKALKKFNDLSGVDKLQHQNGEKTARTTIKILQ